MMYDSVDGGEETLISEAHTYSGSANAHKTAILLRSAPLFFF